MIPVDCFIEGPKKEKLSKPYVIYDKKGRRPFALAGIWESWINKETGEVNDTFAIITTVSNSLLQQVGHHRSPVILPRDWEKDWLNPNSTLADITAMLQPFPGEELNAYPISTDIKNPRANGLDLLKPIGERMNTEYDYELHSELKLFGMGMSTARKRKKEE